MGDTVEFRWYPRRRKPPPDDEQVIVMLGPKGPTEIVRIHRGAQPDHRAMLDALQKPPSAAPSRDHRDDWKDK